MKKTLGFFGLVIVVFLFNGLSGCSKDRSASQKLDKEELKQTLELKISTEHNKSRARVQ